MCVYVPSIVTSIDNGLGGPIRLLLEDAQVPYEWIHIDVAQTWPKTKQSWIDSGYPFDCAPMIKLEDGKQYSGAQPILRFLSKSLGKSAYYLSRIRGIHYIPIA